MGVEPENTLRSFVAAQEAGLDVIGVDLRLSRDGALVALHDADVDRTTDGTGAVADKTLAELRTLDAGRGERIPILEEVLEAVQAPLQAEITDVPTARALAKVLNERDPAGRVRVASFHDATLTEIAQLVPGVRTTLVADSHGTDVVERATAAGASAVCLGIRRLTLEVVEMARKADLAVLGRVVNTQDHLRLARALELDGVTTDYPEIKRTARFTA